MLKRNAFRRAHYRAVAEIIARAKAQGHETGADAIGAIEQAFADTFARDHCKFKRTVFHGAALAPEARPCP